MAQWVQMDLFNDASVVNDSMEEILDEKEIQEGKKFLEDHGYNPDGKDIPQDACKFYHDAEIQKDGELCTKWLGGVKNDVGCFVYHIHSIELKKKGCMLRTEMALSYPYVVGTCDIESNKDNSYGTYSPLTNERPFFEFSVFDKHDEVKRIIAEKLKQRVQYDGNISEEPKKILYKIADEIAEMALEELINGEDTCEETTREDWLEFRGGSHTNESEEEDDELGIADKE